MQNVTKIPFFWLWYPGGDIDQIYILSKSQGLVAAKPYPHPLLKKNNMFSLFILLVFFYISRRKLISLSNWQKSTTSFSFCNFFITVGINSTISSINCSCSESWNNFLFCFNWLLSFLFDGALSNFVDGGRRVSPF